ncbi:uncharacterized protein ACA1_371290 [Acanthamoeba castellanii str. Neff]|uniref:Uncharacterized protein n=1 Tax=Acanthamoeba castellanii (strain ATCC 30010 / Neff) TaxID=1257118 RepID=L8GYE6_ACACF|nr:uncharacterized protein ACA1_371290 [Acanthamoeba castellanii str. Neff]ELR18304.1 hypothetical protein ACA1_371290 [Acanthamoeba castellanii str. Neff]
MNAPNAEFASHFAGVAPFGGRAWAVPRPTFTGKMNKKKHGIKSPRGIRANVDRPEFTTFIVGQDCAIRQVDISLLFAGIYAKQDPTSFLAIFDQAGKRIGGFTLGGIKDEEWATVKKAQKKRDTAHRRDRKYRIALIVVLVVAAILLAAGVIAAVTTTSLF